MNYIGKLLGINFLEVFTSAFEVLNRFNEGFSRPIVRFFGTTDDGEGLSLCQPFVSILVV